jgi:hypothetical protein
MKSSELADKAVQAAVAAIEIYNKPNFSYREESFSLLMLNAWELLLKAKWLADHAEKEESLFEYAPDANGNLVPKTNRSGNKLSLGCVYLATKLLEDTNSGFEKPGKDNLFALIEIRDNSAHFLNKDLYLGRRVLEIGTASLTNFLGLATEWFQLDLSRFNFFLMPISFYHGFEAAEPASRVHYPTQIQNLLTYLDELEEQEEKDSEECTQHLSLKLETKFVRGKDANAVAFRLTNEPGAPVISVREEDVLKNYPMTYRDLSNAMKRRYEDFRENSNFHKLRKGFEKEPKFVRVRILDPNNPSPKSTRKCFYNSNILQEFDKHYKRRQKTT